MFVIEVRFKDNKTAPEMILVRRSRVLIGASENANVIIDDMIRLGYQMLVLKSVGQRFQCKLLPLTSENEVRPLEKELFEGYAFFDLDPIELTIVSIDPDLNISQDEPLDRAGIRILQQACAHSTPDFPAVVTLGSEPMAVSFRDGQSIYVGRSNKCALRIDSAEVSGKHLRIGCEAGNFWVEDLGSTNGTFVDGRQISGRVNVKAEIPIYLGSDISICGVSSFEELARVTQSKNIITPQPTTQRYPVLLSLSEVARPARLVLSADKSVTIGRDPNNDMWLGAPHVSRRHCEVTLNSNGVVQVKDHSTNGTNYDDNVLKNGETVTFDNEPKVLNFGGNLTVAICFSKDDEEIYTKANGESDVFFKKPEVQGVNPYLNIEKERPLDLPPEEFNIKSEIGRKRQEEIGVNNDIGDFERYFCAFSFSKQILWVVISITANVLITILLIMSWSIVKNKLF